MGSAIAYVLAWESAAHEIDSSRVFSNKSGVEGSDVIMYPHTRPVLRQHGAAKGFNFAKAHGLHPGALKSKAETTDAREQVEDSHVYPPPVPITNDSNSSGNSTSNSP